MQCPPEELDEHPGARSVFVHPVPSPQEACEYADAETQTVAVYPWPLCRALRDALVRRGGSRLVETGLSGILRLGGTHDGMDPLRGFVRIVATEGGSARLAKGMAMPLDTTAMVEDREFKDLVI